MEQQISDGKSCAHPGCNCHLEESPGESGDYCSEQCRLAVANHDMVCQCGHPDCGGPVS